MVELGEGGEGVKVEAFDMGVLGGRGDRVEAITFDLGEIKEGEKE